MQKGLMLMANKTLYFAIKFAVLLLLCIKAATFFYSLNDSKS